MMTLQRIGIIHPGEMGISLAAAAQKSGHPVYWASRDAARRPVSARQNSV